MVAGKTLQEGIEVDVLSFGFKHGVPLDADLVYDVRFLPNPYYDLALRPQTGLDEPARRLRFVAEAIAAAAGAEDRDGGRLALQRQRDAGAGDGDHQDPRGPRRIESVERGARPERDVEDRDAGAADPARERRLK